MRCHLCAIPRSSVIIYLMSQNKFIILQGEIINDGSIITKNVRSSIIVNLNGRARISASLRTGIFVK